MTKGTGYARRRSPAIGWCSSIALATKDVECLHAETGATYWQFRYPTEFEDRYGYNNGPRSSPVIDGDRVYTYGAKGKLHCLELKTGK